MKYTIRVSTLAYLDVEVEAENSDEAEELAECIINEEGIFNRIANDGEMEGLDYEVDEW